MANQELLTDVFLECCKNFCFHLASMLLSLLRLTTGGSAFQQQLNHDKNWTLLPNILLLLVFRDLLVEYHFARALVFKIYDRAHRDPCLHRIGFLTPFLHWGIFTAPNLDEKVSVFFANLQYAGNSLPPSGDESFTSAASKLV